MPTYEFSCKLCEKQFQAKVSWRDKGSVRCPKCDSADLKELFGNYSVNVGSSSRQPVQPACHGCASAGQCPHAS